MAPDSSTRSHVLLVAMVESSGAEPHADARRVLISARRSLSQVLQLYAPRRAEVIFRKMGACRRADRSVGISMRTTLDHTDVLASSQGPMLDNIKPIRVSISVQSASIPSYVRSGIRQNRDVGKKCHSRADPGRPAPILPRVANKGTLSPRAG
jgi:hypothetical protein